MMQLKGYDFHRQRPINDYIVDFYCSELMLVIEIDGESHYGNESRANKRQREFEKSGVNKEIFYPAHPGCRC